MLHPIVNPVPKLKNDTGNEEHQFNELIKEINYACKKVQSKKWNLAQYWDYMADFFDYIELPEDGQIHREMAKDWQSGMSVSDILIKYIPAPSLAEIKRM